MSASGTATGVTRFHYRVPAWLSISPDLVDSGLPALYLADAGVGRRSLPLPLSFPGHFGLVLQVVEIAVDNYVDKELSDGSVLRPSCCTASPAGGRVLGPRQMTGNGTFGVSRETLSGPLRSMHPRQHKQPGYVYFTRLSGAVRAERLESPGS